MSDLVSVLVTTEFNDGVFFGYAPKDAKLVDGQLRIENARLCVFWSADVGGVLGLAANGPTIGCRIGPRVPAVTLVKVTSVSEMTDTAAKAFEDHIDRRTW